MGINKRSTYGARLNGGVTGTNCRFWVYVLTSSINHTTCLLMDISDSGCTGPVIGTISTENPEVEMPDGANGIRCSVPGSD